MNLFTDGLTCSFIKAKSELALEDVTEVVEVGLELFRISENKLFAQVISSERYIFMHILFDDCLSS